MLELWCNFADLLAPLRVRRGSPCLLFCEMAQVFIFGYFGETIVDTYHCMVFYFDGLVSLADVPSGVDAVVTSDGAWLRIEWLGETEYLASSMGGAVGTCTWDDPKGMSESFDSVSIKTWLGLGVILDLVGEAAVGGASSPLKSLTTQESFQLGDTGIVIDEGADSLDG